MKKNAVLSVQNLSKIYETVGGG